MVGIVVVSHSRALARAAVALAADMLHGRAVRVAVAAGLDEATFGTDAVRVKEAIEEVDAGQIEAVAATGAGTLQTWWVAIVPQVMPVLLGTTIYRWDINVRESSVLGFVGAGGIGLLLHASINTFAWSQVLVILIAILVIGMGVVMAIKPVKQVRYKTDSPSESVGPAAGRTARLRHRAAQGDVVRPVRQLPQRGAAGGRTLHAREPVSPHV